MLYRIIVSEGFVVESLYASQDLISPMFFSCGQVPVALVVHVYIRPDVRFSRIWYGARDMRASHTEMMLLLATSVPALYKLSSFVHFQNTCSRTHIL
jgi:hypothetical protein